MNILLNIVMAFYPAALVWSFIPTTYLNKLDALSSSDLVDFIFRLVAFGLIFFISYKAVSRSSSRYGRRGGLSVILGIISVVLLLIVIFFQILPGDVLYKEPEWISNYVLKIPYSFFAVLIPLVYLFFD